MNARQEVQFTMFRVVIAHCNNHAAITASLPAFAPALAGLQAVVNEIAEASAKKSTITTGIRKNKRSQSIELSRTASAMAAAVFAYAASQNNSILKEQVRFSFTKLLRLPDEKLSIVSQNIHKAATNHIAALAPFGITPATLTTLQTTISNYQSAVPAPRSAISQRSAYVSQLITLFTQANSIVKNQLDKLALQFKTTHPEFYSQYIHCRTIIDPHTTHTQVAGIIFSSSKQPLAEVAITIPGTGFATTTNADGKFKIKIPQPGAYTLRCTAPGGQPILEKIIQLKLGKIKRIRITLA